MEFPYERIAMRGGELPEGLNWLDTQNFFTLRDSLYARLNAGLITREQGKREKAKIVKAYNDALAEKEFARKLTGHCVRLWRGTEQAASAYRKNRTLEAADRLADVLDGIMRPAEGREDG